MEDFDWAGFASITNGNPHWPMLERAVALFDRPGTALDLGCGAGRDTRYLLAQGWRVTAVDAEPAGLALLAQLHAGSLRLVQSSMQDFPFEAESYDLINAAFSLPFTGPGHFGEVFTRIKRALKPGGVFCGNFFGVNDEWNKPGSGIAFVTREQADALLSGLEVVEITDEERDSHTAFGQMKHWHGFHIIARKSAGSQRAGRD